MRCFSTFGLISHKIPRDFCHSHQEEKLCEKGKGKDRKGDELNQDPMMSKAAIQQIYQASCHSCVS